ncbi:hypothetical protein [Escherichia coli]|uniref:hypothetical protein n=1 Tax=Escherichia coli TaxID=562 RepID=UPI00388E7102
MSGGVILPDIDAVASQGHDFNFGVFSAEFFPNPRHDSYRTILHLRHSDAANVQTPGDAQKLTTHCRSCCTIRATSTQAIGKGKWHMGENKKSRSRKNVSF